MYCKVQNENYIRTWNKIDCRKQLRCMSDFKNINLY